jgi:hypothetical protein
MGLSSQAISVDAVSPSVIRSPSTAASALKVLQP